MAKKRRAKKKAKSKKRKVKKSKGRKKVKKTQYKTVKVVKKVRVQRPPTPKQSARILSIAGGIIILVGGILALIFPNLLVGTDGGIIPSQVVSVISMVLGFLVLLLAGLIRKKPVTSGVLILVFSIVALVFPPHGLIIGPILSIIGSLLVLFRRR